MVKMAIFGQNGRNTGICPFLGKKGVFGPPQGPLLHQPLAAGPCPRPGGGYPAPLAPRPEGEVRRRGRTGADPSGDFRPDGQLVKAVLSSTWETPSKNQNPDSHYPIYYYFTITILARAAWPGAPTGREWASRSPAGPPRGTPWPGVRDLPRRPFWTSPGGL